jgi:hypothetical protein
MLAKIAMIAITTNNSISVKALAARGNRREPFPKPRDDTLKGTTLSEFVTFM